MAFLDNSGDIILDAVLTDVGRKKLSDGTFSITSYGLGDDEINYGTYNLNHPSGSAYYDLEIMQTPVLEAWSAVNANVNYGLLTITNMELEYLPVLALNDGKANPALARLNGLYYLATNSDTYTALTVTTTTYVDNVLNRAQMGPDMILVESGLDTYDLPATTGMVNNYLRTNDLLDDSLQVEADSRFITSVGSLDKSGYLRNDSTNILEWDLKLVYRPAQGTSSDLEGYSTYTTRGLADGITDPTTSGDGDIWSGLKGPRGTVGGLNFDVDITLQSTSQVARKFQEFGTVGATSTVAGVPSAAGTYDFLDTIVYVQGRKSGATLQIPIRIIRQNTA